MTPEKIEAAQFNRLARIMKICGALMIILSVIKVLLSTNNSSGFLGRWLDTAILAGLGIYFFRFPSKKINERTGQFIEWQQDKFIFKVKGFTEVREIAYDDIKTINISLDQVTIDTGQTDIINLDISDFSSYDDRIRIKKIFEDLKTRPNSQLAPPRTRDSFS